MGGFKELIMHALDWLQLARNHLKIVLVFKGCMEKIFFQYKLGGGGWLFLFPPLGFRSNFDPLRHVWEGEKKERLDVILG